MPLSELLPFVKGELKREKLWREEYEPELRAVTETISSTADVGPGERPANIAIDLPEHGSHDWFVHTIDLIRQRFFTLKDFSGQGRAYFSEDFDFDGAAVEKNLRKFPELQQWLPELAARFEAEFADTGTGQNHLRERVVSSFTEENIEAVVKAFTEEKGTKLGVIMNGARTMLTGVSVGPSMLSVFEIIGLEKTITRLKSHVAWTS
ncbi:MAG: hypothetical protein H0X08_06025 [Blastocatellia bacterium]|nr:hypothetical protein [Blastocatellia bacterium]